MPYTSPGNIAAIFNVSKAVVLKGARRVSDLVGFELHSLAIAPAEFLAKYRRSPDALEYDVPPSAWEHASVLASRTATLDAKPHVLAASCIALALKHQNASNPVGVASKLARVSPSSVRRGVVDLDQWLVVTQSTPMTSSY